MAGRFSWLDRTETESAGTYDNRINRLAAFHSGYAFLSYENYCPEFNAFAVYTVWNDEFNKKLANPLPEGGFMIHCDAKRAEEMCAVGHGFPVFVKLLSKLGRLYVESFVLADKSVVFDLYFNGCDVKKPEGLVFMGNEEPQLLPVMQREEAGTEAPVRGSFRNGSYYRGSFIRGSYIKGSYIKGSYLKGAYGNGSYIRGSYTGGSFHTFGGSYTGGLSGSYLSWFFGGSSYLKQLFGAGSYSGFSFSQGSFSGFGGSFGRSIFSAGSFLRSSYLKGSYLSGSFIKGSYISGSYTGRYFLTGSFYNGSYHLGSFIYGGFADVQVSSCEPFKEEKGIVNRPNEGFVLRRLIEELGYGLDLI